MELDMVTVEQGRQAWRKLKKMQEDSHFLAEAWQMQGPRHVVAAHKEVERFGRITNAMSVLQFRLEGAVLGPCPEREKDEDENGIVSL
jgi:fructose-1,6-bisphosphatase